MQEKDHQVDLEARQKGNRRIAGAAVGILAIMIGLTAYSPELYRIFCQVTGFGGTTQAATALPNKVLDQEIEVLTVANVAASLDWEFAPAQHSLQVKLGDQGMAIYRAKNVGDGPIAGTASFNVSPPSAGYYFNKIECFCFTRQVLEPGEEVEMPVVFFIDPEIKDDDIMGNLPAITLSYTFYLDEDQPDTLAQISDTSLEVDTHTPRARSL